MRHGKEEFTYTTRDNRREDLNGKVESKLSVSRAILRHKGKYQCNINHTNAHFLHVHKSTVIRDESGEKLLPFDSEDDHKDLRMEIDKPIASTMMTMSFDVTKAPVLEYSERESFAESDDSPESYADQTTSYGGFLPSDYETTSLVLTTTSFPALLTTTNTPPYTTTQAHHHPTHATIPTDHMVHTTHEIPSEVKSQNHLDKHRHKGSQNDTENDSKKLFFRLFVVSPDFFHFMLFFLSVTSSPIGCKKSFRFIVY